MTCPTGKRSYETRVEARQARRKYPGEARRAYTCDQCGTWHLGRLKRALKMGRVA